MGGQNNLTTTDEQNYQPVGINPEQDWRIPSVQYANIDTDFLQNIETNTRPELVTQGMVDGVTSLGKGLVNGATSYMSAGMGKGLMPYATAQAASAGQVGPVANMTPTPQMQATKRYMQDPRLMEFLAMQYPTSFKYNPNLN
jgi:hypothetical protein